MIFVIGVFSIAAGATALNTNLVSSPSGGESCGRQMSTFGWTGGSFTNGWFSYSAFGGVSPRTGNCLMGYYNSLTSMKISKDIYQDISVSDLSSSIDAGAIIAQFTGYFLMSATNGGTTSVQLSELNASGNVVKSMAVQSTTTNAWTRFSYNIVLESGVRTLRLSLSGTDVSGGFAAFDDFNLTLISSTNKAPTVSAIASQSAIAGIQQPAISFTYNDADTPLSQVTVTVASDNSTILPASAISLTASNGSGSLIFTPVSGQSGTLNITLTISDGIKTIYSVIPVTVNPDYAFDANLVLNANGESKTWWTGRTAEETSCLTAQGTYFQINSGSPCIYQMAPYQELDLGKFTALIDQGWAGFSSNCSVTQSGSTIPSCYFVALNSARQVIDTIARSGAQTGMIPSNTRYIQATMRGFSGSRFTGFSFIMTATGFPKATSIVNQTINGGENTGALPFVFGYKGSAPVLTTMSSNTAVIPSANIVLDGVNYLRTVTVTAPTGVSGSSTIIVKTGTTTLLSFVVTVTGLPGAPTIGTAIAGDARATVSFTAPASNGEAAITSYTVTSDPGGITATGTASPITITGLTNGTSYTFTVTAANGLGTGPASAASNAVVPKGIQTITFANPGSQSFGTSPVITATASSGLTVDFSSSTTSVCTIASDGTLTFLSSGTCSVSAAQSGNTTYAAAITVSQSFTVSAILPGAPTIGAATAGDAQATVSFTAPASNGGAAITSYTVTSDPGGITATGTASPITITGLTNGTSYTFTVTATNDVGTGPASAASNAVVPKGTQTITFDKFNDVVYGAIDFAPSASVTSGLDLSFASDNEAVATITAGGLVHVAGAGSANITASQGGNTAYTAATPVSKTLTVKKALLTITARDTSIMEGDTDPIFQFTFSGFVNGEDSSVLNNLDATRDPGFGDSTYTITPSASSENYEISFVNGTLTIMGTTVAKVLNPDNVQFQFAKGMLSVRGWRGNLKVFSLNGSEITGIRIDHDGIYALNLGLGRYVFCLGSRRWTVQVQPR